MLNEICESIVIALTARDIPAVQAYPEGRLNRDMPCVTLSVENAEFTRSGWGSYLGTKSEGGVVSELYGGRAELSLKLTVYTPAWQGSDEARRLLDESCSALAEGLPNLHIKKISCGEPGFDGESEMFSCPCRIECSAYLVKSRSEETGIFSDFYLKGEMNGHEC